MQEFIDYDEGKHIPLILCLAPATLIYKRRYLVRDQELTKSGNLVVTELGFADQEEFASWMGKLLAPGIAEQVAEDEGRFLDRSRSEYGFRQTEDSSPGGGAMGRNCFIFLRMEA